MLLCFNLILKSQSGNLIPKKNAAKEIKIPIKGTSSKNFIKNSMSSPSNFFKKKESRYLLPFKIPSQVIYYVMISATTPDATVLPPSLIANLNPVSIAIG